jgi:hypothetical protein
MKMKLLKTSVIAILTMAFLISTEGAAKLDLSRLLVLYTCDEDSGEVLKDASGNGWDADIPNAKWEDGVFGKAVRMQRTNSEVNGDIISSTAETREISIMCWVNMTAHSTYNGLVSMSNPACDASCCYRLMINPSKNPFWNAGAHTDQSLANFTFELDKWYHYAMVVDDEVTKIYVDGELIGEQAKGFEFPEFDEVALYVGTGESPGTWIAEDCAFDEVTVWNKALDEDEMKDVMEGYKVFAAVDANGKLAFTWAALKAD